MTTPAAVPAGTTVERSQIGIWGAPASGKSTFLSSLFIATTRATDHITIRGNDSASTDFLVVNTALMQNHEFPPPTVDRPTLNWTLQMWVPNPNRRFLRPGTPQIPFDFNINIQDAGGLEFEPLPQVSSRLQLPGGDSAENENIASYLGRCQGLLMLIDPLRERTQGDAYKFFFGPLLRMAQEQPVPAGDRMPHYVAVCVTKFDHPRVFGFARDNGYLSYRDDDPAFLPRVHPNEAERFMRHLFQDPQFQDPPSRDIELVIGGLRQYFYPDHVKYFISSAVGFDIDPSEPFDQDSYMNVSETTAGAEIVGAVRPINVVEPMVWLGEQLAAEEQSHDRSGTRPGALGRLGQAPWYPRRLLGAGVEHRGAQPSGVPPVAEAFHAG
jgi:hypothetical protein